MASLAWVGICTLTTFTLHMRTTLYQAIESFKSNRKAIRDLREELEALDGVLQSLTETATANQTHLDALKLPHVVQYVKISRQSSSNAQPVLAGRRQVFESFVHEMPLALEHDLSPKDFQTIKHN